MKLESDTLYQQWRNLTTYCPERCDPAWIDLEITPVLEGDRLQPVLDFQRQPKGRAKFGYEWFIEDMFELLQQQGHEILPRVGASSLTLRYQTPSNDDDKPLFFDYFIVPKLSRFSAVYACPDEGFATVLKTGRFVPSNYARSAVAFDLEDTARRIAEEGEDFYQLRRAYNTEAPLPNEPLRRSRRNRAEAEWIDINMIASFRFNKGSVQLLYMPTDQTVVVSCLSQEANIEWLQDKKSQRIEPAKVSLPQRVKRRREEESEQSHSAPLMVTAAAVMADSLALDDLSDMVSEGLADEEFTDIVTSRKLIDDKRLEEIKESETEDDDLEESHNPYSSFIFSSSFETLERNADPMHENRKTDPNRTSLYRRDGYINFLHQWMVSVYDPVSEEFAAKTLEEWQADCVIDGVELLPVEYLPRLLNRGLSSDQILFLSTQIKEGTPEAQVNTLVDAFINEETEVRLR